MVEMKVYVLRKSIGSYDDADYPLCGVFDSQEKAVNHIKEVESVSDVPVDSEYSNNGTIWTKSCFHDPIDQDYNACYSIVELEINKGVLE